MHRTLFALAMLVAACGSVPDIYFVDGGGGGGGDGSPDDATTTDAPSDTSTADVSMDSPIGCNCVGSPCTAATCASCGVCKLTEVCCATTPNIMCKPASGCH